MRTLTTQVKLRRLVRAFAESAGRLASEPAERRLAGSVADRLGELSEDVREAWRRESLAGRPDEALAAYADAALRTIQLAIAGLQQEGADIALLRRDFESAALPFEVFLRGLAAEPALARSA